MPDQVPDLTRERGTAPDWQSALLILVPAAEPAVGEHRARLDASARDGVPAHLTVLYPFLPPAGRSHSRDAAGRPAPGNPGNPARSVAPGGRLPAARGAASLTLAIPAAASPASTRCWSRIRPTSSPGVNDNAVGKA